MTEPAVVIEIAAEDRGSPLAAMLIAACTEALPAGPCALASEAEPSAGRRTSTAVVAWGDDHRVARIEVARRRSGDRTLTRTVEFKDEDLPSERWRAVGLIVATLVGEAKRAAEAAEQKEATRLRAAPLKREAAPSHPAPPTAPRWSDHDTAWIDAMARAGPAFDDGSWRIGGIVRGSYAPVRAPAFAAVAIEYAVRPEDDAGLSARWVTLAFGLGVAVSPESQVRFDGRLEVFGQNVRAEVVDAEAGASDAANEWLAGGRAGADIVWMPTRWAGVVLGGDAWILQRGVQVLVRSAPVVRERPLGFALSLGGRFAFR